MNHEQRLAALLSIKVQLQEWAAHMPEFYYKIHGCADTNIAYQQCKMLIEEEIYSQLEEQDSGTCLGIHNIQ